MKKLSAKELKCKFCSGRGWTLDVWATCPKCNGSGKVKTKKED